MQRKVTFIDQIMRGDLAAVRSIEDIGDAALSYAEVKALASGNPLIKERGGVAKDLVRLERQLAAHHQDQGRLARTQSDAGAKAARLRAEACRCRAADAVRIHTAGDRFAMTVAEAGHTKASTPGVALNTKSWSNSTGFLTASDAPRSSAGSQASTSNSPPLARPGTRYGELSIAGLPGRVVDFNRVDLRAPQGLITPVERYLGGLGDKAEQAEAEAARARTEAARRPPWRLAPPATRHRMRPLAGGRIPSSPLGDSPS